MPPRQPPSSPVLATEQFPVVSPSPTMVGIPDPAVTEHRALISAAIGFRLSSICSKVLARAVKLNLESIGIDGVSYEAMQMTSGRNQTAVMWSPEKETLAHKFVAMEGSLRAYVDAKDDERASKSKALLNAMSRTEAQLLRSKADVKDRPTKSRLRK